MEVATFSVLGHRVMPMELAHPEDASERESTPELHRVFCYLTEFKVFVFSLQSLPPNPKIFANFLRKYFRSWDLPFLEPKLKSSHKK